MYVVGLTGGIGCGKSEAARVFERLGVPVVDVDLIARELTQPGEETLSEIIEIFGKEYLLPDGNLDRAKLRDKVFMDIAARKDLEGIIHPAIHERALKGLEANKDAPYQVLAISLLFENQRYKDVVTRSLVMDCSEQLQVERTMRRSGLTEQIVRGIMAAQVSRAIRLKMADDVIVNEGTLEELAQKVEDVHKKYMQACRVSE
ncbi:MAG TPA: dephospho-CoA kinase [Methylophilaceae bacterium]|nr:dephospho-CoA kinase [Methylophilaceae bacterium]